MHIGYPFNEGHISGCFQVVTGLPVKLKLLANLYTYIFDCYKLYRTSKRFDFSLSTLANLQTIGQFETILRHSSSCIFDEVLDIPSVSTLC